MFFFKKKIVFLLFIVSFIFQSMPSFSKEIVAVVSDNLSPVQTNYMIYPELSNLLCQDVANIINLNNRISALPVANSIDNATKSNVKKDILTFMKEYKYTYVVNYRILRKISETLEADYILLITSGIDPETNFLKPTFWNQIPIAGENSVNPSYRIVTHIALIHPEKELILVNSNFDSRLKSDYLDLSVPTFAPTYAQLNRVHKYALKLSPEIAYQVESTIVPDLVPKKKTYVEVAYENAKSNIKKVFPIPEKDDSVEDSDRKLFSNPFTDRPQKPEKFQPDFNININEDL